MIFNKWAAWDVAPYVHLPPEELARLTADPALRSRYCVLAATLPSLRWLSVIFATKSRLNDNLEPARLDPLPPWIGRDWTSLLGTLSILYTQLQVYVGQFESLVGALGGGAGRPAAAGRDGCAPYPGLSQHRANQGRGHEEGAAGRSLVRVAHGGEGPEFYEKRREGGGDVRRSPGSCLSAG